MSSISIKNPLRRAALNIEEHSDRGRFPNQYFPTKQAEAFIGNISFALTQRKGDAHALSGPYGTGKSSLAIFAMHQLCASTKSFSPQPFKMRDKSADKCCLTVRKKGGLIAICAVGASLPIASRIISGAQQALTDYAGKQPKALKAIANLNVATVDHSNLIRMMGELVDEVSKHKKAGVLLIIDEFGRHLERMVTTRDSSDMQLLQGLAETTGTRKNAFSLIVIQHYGLEHYARYLLKNDHIEWEKTRGRFRETLFENSEQDVADIIGSLFTCKEKPTESQKRKISNIISGNKLFRHLGDDFFDSAIKCWPLHPATIVALARLSVNLGQNDRTVVGWMMSGESSGFMQAAKDRTGWILPSALYNHFFSNPQHIPVNAIWAKRVSEIYAAEEHFSGDENALILLQTIAVLNCLGGGVADNDTLKMCLPERFSFDKSMSYLLDKSLIIYRKYRGEYCVWRGSDYDIAGSISEAAEKMENFSLASVLNDQFFTPQIIAQRYFLEKGNMHALPLEFVDGGQAPPYSDDKKRPRVLIYLKDSTAIHAINEGDSIKAEDNDIYGILCVDDLKSHGIETEAMRYLLETDSVLQQETAARKEIENFWEFSQQQLRNRLWDRIFTHKKWFLRNKKYNNLNIAVFDTVERAYEEGFQLNSLLINRDHSNGAITAALRALCKAMIESPNIENIGIEKHPPQMMIYKGFLREKRLHIKKGDSFQFVFDVNSLKDDMKPVVEKMNKMLGLDRKDNHEMVKVPVQSIIDTLAMPPYGIKRIPSIILCIVCLLYNKDRLALYEDNKYVFAWGNKEIERFIADPARFEISSVPYVWSDKKLLSDYYQSITGAALKTATVITVARVLLEKWKNFDPYAVKSDSVSPQAQKFRRAIATSKSPADMLFTIIPAALDSTDFSSSLRQRKKFFTTLTRVLDELEKASANLMERFVSIFIEHYSCKTLELAMQNASKEAKMILSQGRVYPLHKKFLAALQEQTTPSEWVERVLISTMDLPKKLKDWTDIDEEQTEFLLRMNLSWLRSVTKFTKNLPADEFIVVGGGKNLINSTVDERALEEAKACLLKNFPNQKDLEQAMLKLNYQLSKQRAG